LPLALAARARLDLDTTTGESAPGNGTTRPNEQLDCVKNQGALGDGDGHLETPTR
jgi:hypothetical protein